VKRNGRNGTPLRSALRVVIDGGPSAEERDLVLDGVDGVADDGEDDEEDDDYDRYDEVAGDHLVVVDFGTWREFEKGRVRGARAREVGGRL